LRAAKRCPFARRHARKQIVSVRRGAGLIGTHVVVDRNRTETWGQSQILVPGAQTALDGAPVLTAHVKLQRRSPPGVSPISGEGRDRAGVRPLGSDGGVRHVRRRLCEVNHRGLAATAGACRLGTLVDCTRTQSRVIGRHAASPRLIAAYCGRSPECRRGHVHQNAHAISPTRATCLSTRDGQGVPASPESA